MLPVPIHVGLQLPRLWVAVLVVYVQLTKLILVHIILNALPHNHILIQLIHIIVI